MPCQTTLTLLHKVAKIQVFLKGTIHILEYLNMKETNIRSSIKAMMSNKKIQIIFAIVSCLLLIAITVAIILGLDSNGKYIYSYGKRYIPLVNKYYGNRAILREQNISKKILPIL